MDLPIDFIDIVEASINNNNKTGRQLVAVNERVLDLAVVNGDTKELDDNLTGWKLVSADANKLEINLEFREPSHVSQGDIPDKLLIQFEMEQFKD